MSSQQNIAGDNLCRLADADIAELKADPTKIPPISQFLESCSRFHAQITGAAGVLGPECMTIAQLEARVAELALENTSLRAFAQGVMEGWPQDDGIGACELQEIATMHGLLVKQTMTEPCGESCACAEVGEFPTECYRKTALLTGDAAKGSGDQ